MVKNIYDELYYYSDNNLILIFKFINNRFLL